MAKEVAAVEQGFDTPFVRLANREHRWIVAFFVAMFVSVLLAVGFVKVATGSRTVVHIVQVDAVGRVIYSGPPATLEDPELLIRHELAEFILDLRTVVRDPNAMFRNRARGLEHVTSPVRQVINESFEGDQDPLVLGGQLYREVRIHSTLRLSEVSWQVNWTEIDRSYVSGRRIVSRTWVAHVETRLSKSLSTVSNPLGLEITSLAWSPQVTSEVGGGG